MNNEDLKQLIKNGYVITARGVNVIAWRERDRSAFNVLNVAQYGTPWNKPGALHEEHAKEFAGEVAAMLHSAAGGK